MMKRIMTTIAILATLTLTGCSLNNELSPFIPVEAAVNSETSTVSEVEEPTASTSEVENESSINNEAVASTTSTTESKPEEKPVESTSSTVEKPVESTSTTTEKPVASTTTSKVEKPVASSSSTKPVASSSSTTSKVEKPASSSTSTSSKPVASSTTTSKPVEKPVESSSSTTTSKPVEKVHNCSTDGHVWEVTTTTTEPKWCREMHHVCDYGFDTTLANRYLDIQEDTYKIFKKTCKENGVSGVCSSGSVEVEVWGTESFETKTCKFCNHSEVQVGKGTITPMGEWRYIDGQNPRFQVTGVNMNTLFYDPYNVPQVVIDNIRLYQEIR